MIFNVYHLDAIYTINWLCIQEAAELLWL